VTDLVVRSERVVLPDFRSSERVPGASRLQPAAIRIRDGRVIAISSYEDVPAGVPVLDPGELAVLPGFVDTHVHMNDPGRADWEGAEHATAAAAAAGVTTVVDMPLNSVPSTTSVSALEAKRLALNQRCAVDVAFWGGVVPGNSGELRSLARGGVLGFKAFLSPSGVPEFECVTEADLHESLPVLADFGLPLLVHAEFPPALKTPSGDPRSYRTWLASRPPEAERRAIELLIRLAGEFRAHIHIVHLASGEAVRVLREARKRGVNVSVETCPHYLTFAAEGIRDGATAFKCAPPIRGERDRQRLWRALMDGDIDLVASDHSPAPPSMKSLDSGDFLSAWGGIASLQLAASAVFTGAAARGLGIERVVEWMSTAPARLAGLSGRKGAIAVGADADLVFWDGDAEFEVNPAALHHRHPVTPYAGMRLRGRARTTMLRGEIIFDAGRLISRDAGRMITSAS
jgi:allantoinase